MAQPIEPWSILRALRASPPGRAAKDDARRVVFAAALEQAEQFLSAAATVGKATKPVQLFYSLSQAGRAIAAVRAEEPWEIKGHGASVRTSEDIPTTTVQATTSVRGALGLVARATGSELWEGRVTLATLWASLPEVPHWQALIGSAHPPLEVAHDYSGVVPGYGAAYTTAGLTTGGNWRAGLAVDEIPSDPEERRALVDRILAPYPKAAGWSIAEGWVVNITTFGPEPTRRIFVEWRGTDEAGNTVITAPELLTEQYDGALYFRPGVGRNRAVPSPLITWWGVLLELASLARYEPVIWRQALDIDSSPIAWPLERGLRIAEQRIPELVLNAVANE